MPRISIAALAALLALAGASGATRASASGQLDDASLQAYAARPFDKRAMMGRTVELGRHHGVPVVAEFRCGDVCPQYTVRIIRYRMPQGADCAAMGGVEQSVLVPVAIAVMQRNICVPKVLVASRSYYTN
jgi:hypothetical protein